MLQMPDDGGTTATHTADVDAADLAVLAHALLGATASICGMARALSSRPGRPPLTSQLELIEAMERQGRWVADILGWLVRGAPEQALSVAFEPPR